MVMFNKIRGRGERGRRKGGGRERRKERDNGSNFTFGFKSNTEMERFCFSEALFILVYRDALIEWGTTQAIN